MDTLKYYKEFFRMNKDLLKFNLTRAYNKGYDIPTFEFKGKTIYNLYYDENYEVLDENPFDYYDFFSTLEGLMYIINLYDFTRTTFVDTLYPDRLGGKFMRDSHVSEAILTSIYDTVFVENIDEILNNDEFKIFVNTILTDDALSAPYDWDKFISTYYDIGDGHFSNGCDLLFLLPQVNFYINEVLLKSEDFQNIYFDRMSPFPKVIEEKREDYAKVLSKIKLYIGTYDDDSLSLALYVIDEDSYNNLINPEYLKRISVAKN